jgi:hypothetical protein
MTPAAPISPSTPSGRWSSPASTAFLAGHADQNDHAKRPPPMPSRRAVHRREYDSIPDSGSLPPPAWPSFVRTRCSCCRASSTGQARSAPDGRRPRFFGHRVLIPVEATHGRDAGKDMMAHMPVKTPSSFRAATWSGGNPGPSVGPYGLYTRSWGPQKGFDRVGRPGDRAVSRSPGVPRSRAACTAISGKWWGNGVGTLWAPVFPQRRNPATSLCCSRVYVSWGTRIRR